MATRVYSWDRPGDSRSPELPEGLAVWVKALPALGLSVGPLFDAEAKKSPR